MRLLFVTAAPPDRQDRDGMTMIAFRILPEIARHHQVDIWTLAEPAESAQLPFAHDVKIFRTVRQPLWRYYLGPRRIPYFQARHQSAALHTALRVLPADMYDLIILHSPFVAHYLDDIAGPTIIHSIDAMSDWFTKTATNERHPLRRAHLRTEARAAAKMEATLYSKARAVTVVSEDDANVLRRTTPQAKIVVIPNGIDTATFYPPTANREPATVILTGVMNYPPNVDAATWFVHHVWPTVRQQQPSATLRIVGKDPTGAVQALGTQPGVTVTGRVPSMAEELRRATVAVSPLRYGTGFKNKVLEALACGTPLVLSPTSLPGTSVTPDQECLVATTSSEWATTINQLLASPTHQAELSRAGVTFAAKRPWTVISQQYENLYAEIKK